VKSKNRDWKELCEAASKELDSDRLLVLVAELTEALDQRSTNAAYIVNPDTNRA
jgi:predicted esterase YcpF (UPF0227 family)